MQLPHVGLLTAYLVIVFSSFFSKFYVSLKLSKSFSMYDKQPLTNENLFYECYKWLDAIIPLAIHVIFSIYVLFVR